MTEFIESYNDHVTKEGWYAFICSDGDEEVWSATHEFRKGDWVGNGPRWTVWRSKEPFATQEDANEAAWTFMEEQEL